ncbi:DUF7344 domain-containing protein [Halalkalirubrum salinum]|uniref:DUF7344 domain-containing protein n=1 Tax=Halalkalirubrum salinum TaxID=2563889 RepID=UPI0010FAFEA5|nr:ArsR family transcriptional regulator [Halalkalirubrum salinum]
MSEDERLETAELFEVLSSDRRRALIYFLRSRGGDADLRELAAEIAAWEQDIDPAAVSDDDKKRVYISLYQSHLPKLEEHQIVTYDSDTKQVSSTEQVDHVMGLFTHPTTRWDRFYLAVSALGFVVFGLHLFGVIAVPVVPFTIVLLCTLLGLSIVHYYQYRLMMKTVLSEFSYRSER